MDYVMSRQKEFNCQSLIPFDPWKWWKRIEFLFSVWVKNFGNIYDFCIINHSFFSFILIFLSFSSFLFCLQFNLASAWIDGSAIYGKTKSHAGILRRFQKGMLRRDKNNFPVKNYGFLDLFTPSKNIEDNKIKRPNFSMYEIALFFYFFL